MPKGQAMYWYLMLATTAPSIWRTRKLYSADEKMRGIVRFDLCNRQFEFDIESLISPWFPVPYAFLREVFVRQVYFRAFEHLRYSSCLDLGCNIGVVSHILKRLGGPKATVVGVDAVSYADNRFCAELRATSGIKFDQRVLCADSILNDHHKLQEICTKYNVDPSLATTVDQIMSQHDMDRVDFLKMDIEGAEFAIFDGPSEWLDRVDNMALEVHHDLGDPRTILARLGEKGFSVAWCHNFGHAVDPRYAAYIYASRTGSLRKQTDRWSPR